MADCLVAARLRVEKDFRPEKIGYKIWQAQLQKIPYMLVIGDKELEAVTVAVRCCKVGDIGAMPVEQFLARTLEKIKTKAAK